MSWGQRMFPGAIVRRVGQGLVFVWGGALRGTGGVRVFGGIFTSGSGSVFRGNFAGAGGMTGFGVIIL